MYRALSKIRTESKKAECFGRCIDLKVACFEYLEELLDICISDKNEKKGEYITLLNDLFTTYAYLSFKQGWMLCEEKVENKT